MLPRERRPNGAHPQPVVALVGAHGSGKTTLLDALAGGCGSEIVHSRLDFAQLPQDLFEATLQATATTALLMSRHWPYQRSRPVFHRVGLALLALTAENLPRHPDEARNTIGELIHEYVRQTPGGRLAQQGEAQLQSVVDNVSQLAASRIGAAALADNAAALAKQGIGFLLRGLTGRVLHRAAQWYKHNPALGGADELVDALIELNLYRQDQGVRHLIEALLADMADHANQRPPIAHRCKCVLPRRPDGVRPPHEHAWVLLADNADSGAGHAFLTELAEVRARLVSAAQPVVDPLLVVAGYGTWHTPWASYWYEPWHVPDAEELEHGKRARMPSFTDAVPERWREQSLADLAQSSPTAAWYPVRVPHVAAKQAQAMIQLRGERLGLREFGTLAYQLSGGNPGTIESIGGIEAAVPPGSAAHWPSPGTLMTTALPRRPGPDGADSARRPLWWLALDGRLPSSAPIPDPERPWREVPAAVAAAAYLADPERGRDESLPPSLDGVNPVLGWFQDNLWVSTLHGAPPRLRTLVDEHGELPAALHPWLSRSLLAALALKTVPDPAGGGEVAAWDHLFRRLRNDLVPPPADHAPPDGRSLYYDLALDDFVPVVLRLTGQFNVVRYDRWIRLLAQAAAAPCRLPMLMRQDAALDGLVLRWEESVALPTPVQTCVAKLVALLWLYNDPLVLATPRWDEQIADAFRSLIANATLLNVDPLKNARDRFVR